MDAPPCWRFLARSRWSSTSERATIKAGNIALASASASTFGGLYSTSCEHSHSTPEVGTCGGGLRPQSRTLAAPCAAKLCMGHSEAFWHG
ncbi:hypothetical protein FIBSPDRAFT_134033 [Athelia psychrophila]|uniref:Uncharacterized protein n=1 Tax=Athelia psychrophila TaxID=1759441 RepID=A0A166CBD3_9AGAM|nr:hypothetical protein FIBSPDRAFT_134033 [Fibularhizoctonia sp. CBS 109695]